MIAAVLAFLWIIMSPDLPYLQHALELAATRRGFCAPNPCVGAVIVRNQAVLATGFHYAAGHAHAEIDALQKINHQAQDATLYVTLEPCCHFGKTPPCTEALIASGIKRVVYAFQDPNPQVGGKGHTALAQAGIQCEHISLPEIDTFYESYAHWHRTQTPFLTAKIALSLDGKIAGKNGQPVKITGKELAERTHRYRKQTDAILTTSKTIIADNPQLNARCHPEITLKPLYVLDSQLTLPLDAQVFTTTQSITIFHAKNASAERRANLRAVGVKCIAVDSDEQGLNLSQIIEWIGKDNIHDLWIEAGGACFSAFAQQNLLQQVLFYLAPHAIGEGISAFTFPLDFRNCQVAWEHVGNDVVGNIKIPGKINHG